MESKIVTRTFFKNKTHEERIFASKLLQTVRSRYRVIHVHTQIILTHI